MSNVGFVLGTQARMAASPHMQQAVHMLQLSATEFAQELQQALATNPFLEELEDTEADAELESEGDVAGSVEEPALAAESASADVDIDVDQGAEPIDAPGSDAVVEDAPVYESFEQLDSRQEPSDPYDLVPASTPSEAVMGGSAGNVYDWVSAEISLREHLSQQLCGCGVDLRTQLAATVVIESLEQDGYLRGDLSAAAEAAGIEPPLSESELDAGIRFVQRCDPPGVAARDLSECLVLQLDALDDPQIDARTRTVARQLALEGLDALAHHRYAALRQALACDDAQLNAASALIRRLDPHPGHRFLSLRSEYVVPDVIVQMHAGELIVQVNPAARPAARLNQCYVQWFRAARHQDHPALSQQLQEARWLMHNVEQRFVTIQRVAEAIVRRQRGFFDGGAIAMKPLVLREVADDLGIHESTVSRATGNKYMDTPRGMFEFRHFFSRSLATETGGSCSAASVRALIREMIAGEGAETPLSDVALTRKLGENGVRVSRRTVTKYRNLMKVAPVELRKRA